MAKSAAPDSIAEIESIGLKATLPRIKVLDVFRHSKERHLSAEDVYKALNADTADIGMATVYRVLMQFAQASLLSRNHFESGKAFGICCSGHGSHLAALLCAAVTGFCALLAMVHFMLRAFVTAGLADVGTSGANSLGVFAATGHRCGR